MFTNKGELEKKYKNECYYKDAVFSFDISFSLTSLSYSEYFNKSKRLNNDCLNISQENLKYINNKLSLLVKNCSNNNMKNNLNDLKQEKLEKLIQVGHDEKKILEESLNINEEYSMYKSDYLLNELKQNENNINKLDYQIKHIKSYLLDLLCLYKEEDPYLHDLDSSSKNLVLKIEKELDDQNKEKIDIRCSLKIKDNYI